MNTENLVIGLAITTIAFISIDLTRTLLNGKKPQHSRRHSAPQRVTRARSRRASSHPLGSRPPGRYR